MSQQLPVSYDDHPLLVVSDRQDIFSLGYVLSIIGSAGYNWGKDYSDRNSEDMYVRHLVGAISDGGYSRLGVQIKCTYQFSPSQGFFSYRLKRKNYDDLRNTCEPFILVIVTVPDEMNGCTVFGPDCLVLKHKAYWMSLRGFPALDNPHQEKETIHVPLSQEFNCDSLRYLMAMIAQGVKP